MYNARLANHHRTHPVNTQLMSELLGGAGRYKALRCLFEHPDKGYGPRELAAETGVDPGNLSRWLRRWADLGLLERRTQSRQTIYVASMNPALAPLRTLLQQDSEVVRVLRKRLAELKATVVAAAVFGSSARGETHTDSDIDLLLVTDASRLQAQAHFKAAGRALGRPVNVLTFTANQWAEAKRSGNELVREILRNPTITLQGELNAAQT